MEKRRTIRPTGEDGFAALIIAIVLVLVLSLITVGFAELMRREQRSALDKQLSSQAYYAAESGINDATKAINDGYLGAKNKCGPGQGVDPTTPANSQGLSDIASNLVAIDSAHNPTSASYPCLLINPTPPDLHYGSIATTSSRTTEFTAVDPTTKAPSSVSLIKISWQDAGSKTDFISGGGCVNNFKPTDPPPNNWTYIGALRMQLIPLVSGSLDGSALSNTAFTAFLCPSTAGSPSADYTASIGPNNAGLLLDGGCSAAGLPLDCNISIRNLPASQSTFFINLRSLYAATAVTITAFNGSTQLNLTGAQTLIDSTGKAQDVLRRIQVRIPTDNGYDIPDGTHADICKQLDLDPASTVSNGAGCGAANLSL